MQILNKLCVLALITFFVHSFSVSEAKTLSKHAGLRPRPKPSPRSPDEDTFSRPKQAGVETPIRPSEYNHQMSI